MRRIPLVPVAMALIAGVAMGHQATTMTLASWAILLALAALLLGLLLLFFREKSRPIIFVMLMATFFSIGALRCHLGDPQFDTRDWTTLATEKASFITLRLKESPLPRERSWRALAEVEEIDNQSCEGELRLYLRKDSTAATLRYGDLLMAHGYANREKGTLYITNDHYILISRDSTSLRAHSEALRMKLLKKMQTGPLEHRYRGVAEAMTLGWRGDLESDLNAQFRDAGIMHLLCVSGLHVGLLAAMVGWLMVWVGKERRGRIIKGSVQMLVLWAFAILTGLAPSTTRAALMFSLFIINNMLGRRTDSLNLLAFAAIIMLMGDPMLLFNTGWQLSFSAVAGILLMRPAINLHHNIMWKAAVVSLAATLATLPITLVTFHQIYPYFLIANIVIVPLAGFLLALSFLYMLLPCGFTAFLIQWPTWFCDRLTNSISNLPGALIEGLTPSPWVVALLALSILFTLVTINIILLRRKKEDDLLP